MTIQENLQGDTVPANQAERSAAPRFRLHPLHEVALRLADLGFNRSRTRTKDLVTLLMCHGARAWRSSQPRTSLHLKVIDTSKRSAVHLKIG